MTEYYKKIYIHSEDDLPKEEGLYLSHNKNLYHTQYTSFAPVNVDEIAVERVRPEWWLKNIDWYLQPVTEEELQNELCLYPRIKR